jgi:hypothetical protein
MIIIRENKKKKRELGDVFAPFWGVGFFNSVAAVLYRCPPYFSFETKGKKKKMLSTTTVAPLHLTFLCVSLCSFLF